MAGPTLWLQLWAIRNCKRGRETKVVVVQHRKTTETKSVAFQEMETSCRNDVDVEKNYVTTTRDNDDDLIRRPSSEFVGGDGNPSLVSTTRTKTPKARPDLCPIWHENISKNEVTATDNNEFPLDDATDIVAGTDDHAPIVGRGEDVEIRTPPSDDATDVVASLGDQSPIDTDDKSNEPAKNFACSEKDSHPGRTFTILKEKVKDAVPLSTATTTITRTTQSLCLGPSDKNEATEDTANVRHEQDVEISTSSSDDATGVIAGTSDDGTVDHSPNVDTVKELASPESCVEDNSASKKTPHPSSGSTTLKEEDAKLVEPCHESNRHSKTKDTTIVSLEEDTAVCTPPSASDVLAGTSDHSSIVSSVTDDEVKDSSVRCIKDGVISSKRQLHAGCTSTTLKLEDAKVAGLHNSTTTTTEEDVKVLGLHSATTSMVTSASQCLVLSDKSNNSNDVASPKEGVEICTPLSADDTLRDTGDHASTVEYVSDGTANGGVICFLEDGAISKKRESHPSSTCTTLTDEGAKVAALCSRTTTTMAHNENGQKNDASCSHSAIVSHEDNKSSPAEEAAVEDTSGSHVPSPADLCQIEGHPGTSQPMVSALSRIIESIGGASSTGVIEKDEVKAGDNQDPTMDDFQLVVVSKDSNNSFDDETDSLTDLEKNVLLQARQNVEEQVRQEMMVHINHLTNRRRPKRAVIGRHLSLDDIDFLRHARIRRCLWWMLGLGSLGVVIIWCITLLSEWKYDDEHAPS